MIGRLFALYSHEPNEAWYTKRSSGGQEAASGSS
jgi:hypothetical protein